MKIGGILLEWYKKNKRDLPWRQTTDPYLIWLSEVILQQTRVDQGLPYYLRFSESYPCVSDLAKAPEDELMKHWQGLGYYSRARNLQVAARDVMERLNGQFPDNYLDLLKLKGIGNYTAAAIASMAFGEEVAVVDGNVSRVLARLFGVEEEIDGSTGKRIIASLAQQVLEESPGEPGIHNQALMEFGALQCLPAGPDCPGCPLQEQCQARISGQEGLLPRKKAKRKAVERWMYFYIIGDGKQLLMERRGSGDIWQGLYQFPMVQGEAPLPEEAVLGKLLHQVLKPFSGPLPPAGIQVLHLSDTIPHQLTHRSLRARFIHVKMKPLSLPASPDGHVRLVSRSELDSYPVPRLIERYLQSISFSIFDL